MTVAFPPDERVLLLKVSRGDKIAFRQLYDQMSPLLYSIALRLLKRREAAEEVVQDVFLTLWHAADQYDVQRGSVKTWLSTITRNRCIDRLRRPATTLDHDLDLEEIAGDERDDPLNQMLSTDHLALLTTCFGELDEQQRRCLSLAYFEGMTHQDVSAQLDVPLGSAKTWIRRGLNVLKKCMGVA
ncbi:MAG: sigma-70 family RNA polymerase sigma factor [Pseudomonadota bacterium]|nr:sigma-70 family RNA polymerase sigma factor [Pseudomonadota bacterium]